MGVLSKHSNHQNRAQSVHNHAFEIVKLKHYTPLKHFVSVLDSPGALRDF